MRKFELVSVGEYVKAYTERFDVSVEYAEESYRELVLPRRATSKSSGYDFYTPDGFILKSGEEITIPTGIKAYMQEDEELCIFVRSGAGFKYNIRLKNQVAKIDADYVDNVSNEGHIFIALKNEGDRVWVVNAGEAFVQGSFYKYLITDNDCPIKDERVGGIGSTTRRA